MEHQDHSNENGASEHQVSSVTTSGTATTVTMSTAMPSFRVYVDMEEEQSSNDSVVYTAGDGSKKTCIDNLKNNAHYRFSCRCGCGAQFAGFGRDIKASGKIGRAGAEVVNVTSNDSAHVKITPEVVTITRPGHGLIMNDNGSPVAATLAADLYSHGLIDHTAIEHTSTPTKETDRSEAADTPRPFVSDRYLKKASFGLSDDEIDAYHETRSDPLEAQGVKLSERQPPAIGDMVYSLATGEGPYSLLEYQQHEIDLTDGGKSRLLCGLCRTDTGGYKIIPLADLALHYDGRPIVKKRRPWLVPLVILGSSLVGSLVAAAYFIF